MLTRSNSIYGKRDQLWSNSRYITFVPYNATQYSSNELDWLYLYIYVHVFINRSRSLNMTQCITLYALHKMAYQLTNHIMAVFSLHI